MRGLIPGTPMQGLNSEPDESDESEIVDAVRDFGEALADKDWSAAATALKRAHEICASDHGDSGEDEDEEV